jgi:hypothetical protein
MWILNFRRELKIKTGRRHLSSLNRPAESSLQAHTYEALVCLFFVIYLGM